MEPVELSVSFHIILNSSVYKNPFQNLIALLEK